MRSLPVSWCHFQYTHSYLYIVIEVLAKFRPDRTIPQPVIANLVFQEGRGSPYFGSRDLTSGWVTWLTIPLKPVPGVPLGALKIWWRSVQQFGLQPLTHTHTHKQTDRQTVVLYLNRLAESPVLPGPFMALSHSPPSHSFPLNITSCLVRSLSVFSPLWSNLWPDLCFLWVIKTLSAIFCSFPSFLGPKIVNSVWQCHFLFHNVTSSWISSLVSVPWVIIWPSAKFFFCDQSILRPKITPLPVWWGHFLFDEVTSCFVMSLPVAIYAIYAPCSCCLGYVPKFPAIWASWGLK